MKNVCIVGYGNIGPVHADALKNVENANFYAICDNQPDRIERCQKEYDVIGYTDFHEMLKDENIHSVHICTPHYLHYEMIVAALEAGKNVVSEKPVVMTKEQFENLQANRKYKEVCLVFQNRLNPCAKELKRLIGEGALGKIQCVKGIVTWQRTKEYYLADAWRGKWDTEGGGVLINQTVHTLDLLHYLTGDIASVQATMANFTMADTIEVEDTVTAHLQFANGATGLFFGTNAYGANRSPDIEIVGDKGCARYYNDKLYLNDELICQDVVAVGEKAYWGIGHKGLLRNYYDEGTYFSVDDARNTMYALYGIYESAKNGAKKVDL